MGLFLVVLLLVVHVHSFCDPHNASDTPLTTGCAFCSPQTQLGCMGGGVCYMQPLSANVSIPFCSCPYGLVSSFFLGALLFAQSRHAQAPPQCAFAAPLKPICNGSATPPACQYCIPGSNEGCQHAGTCYLLPVSGLGIPPNTSIPFCGCTYEWAVPQCAVPSVPAPLCNRSNPAVRPPFCEYCRVGGGFPSAAVGCDNFGS